MLLTLCWSILILIWSEGMLAKSSSSLHCDGVDRFRLALPFILPPPLPPLPEGPGVLDGPGVPEGPGMGCCC